MQTLLKPNPVVLDLANPSHSQWWCRIETVGEERARHVSESAAGPHHWSVASRKRAATLGSEVRGVRSRLEDHSTSRDRLPPGEEDQAEDQADLADNCQDDSFESLEESFPRDRNDESFQFPQHPLVVRSYLMLIKLSFERKKTLQFLFNKYIFQQCSVNIFSGEKREI